MTTISSTSITSTPRPDSAAQPLAARTAEQLGAQASPLERLAQTEGVLVARGNASTGIVQIDSGLYRRDHSATNSFGQAINLDGRYRTNLQGSIIEGRALGNLAGGAVATVQVPGQRSSYVVTIQRDGGAVNILDPQSIVGRVREFLSLSARGNVAITNAPVPTQAEGSISFNRDMHGTEWNGDSGSSIVDLNTVSSRERITVYTRQYFNYLQEVNSYRQVGLSPQGGTPHINGIQHDDLSGGVPSWPPLIDPRR